MWRAPVRSGETPPRVADPSNFAVLRRALRGRPLAPSYLVATTASLPTPVPGLFLLEGFARNLRDYDLRDLESDRGSIFALTPDLRLAYANPAWFRFALENGGADVPAIVTPGVPVLQSIHGPLRRFYERRWREVMFTGERWDHPYESSSATRYRLVRSRAEPLREGGILVTNTVAVDRPHDAFHDPVGRPFIESLYLDSTRSIAVCGHCRRARRRDGMTWDWIPLLVEKPRRTLVYTLCPPCVDHYYPPREEDLLDADEP